MEIIRGGEYTKLIARYEALTTRPDGLLGELKEEMEPFEAKLVFSKILKVKCTMPSTCYYLAHSQLMSFPTLLSLHTLRAERQ